MHTAASDGEVTFKPGPRQQHVKATDNLSKEPFYLLFQSINQSINLLAHKNGRNESEIQVLRATRACQTRKEHLRSHLK